MKATARATPSAQDVAPAVELGAPDWSGPTKADVKSQSRRAAQAQRAAALAAYRTSHGIGADVTDTTVWHLMMIEQIGKPSPAATAVHSGETRDTREQRNA